MKRKEDNAAAIGSTDGRFQAGGAFAASFGFGFCFGLEASPADRVR